MDLALFRTRNPMYDDMSDEELGKALYNKYYSGMPEEMFWQKAKGIAGEVAEKAERARESIKEAAGTVVPRIADYGAAMAGGMMMEPIAKTAGMVNLLGAKMVGEKNPIEYARAGEYEARRALQYEPKYDTTQDAMEIMMKREPGMNLISRAIPLIEKGGNLLNEETGYGAGALAAIAPLLGGVGEAKGMTIVGKGKNRVYRGGPPSAMPKGVTAADIIKYETETLGNKIKVEEGVKPENIKSENLEWVTGKREDAKEYGGVSPANIEGEYRVIARDKYGGMLIEKGKPIESSNKIAYIDKDTGEIRRGEKMFWPEEPKKLPNTGKTAEQILQEAKDETGILPITAKREMENYNKGWLTEQELKDRLTPKPSIEIQPAKPLNKEILDKDKLDKVARREYGTSYDRLKPYQQESVMRISQPRQKALSPEDKISEKIDRLDERIITEGEKENPNDDLITKWEKQKEDLETKLDVLEEAKYLELEWEKAKPIESSIKNEVKQPVTFIGMQENSKGEPLPLVNNAEGSTIVYKPDLHEIANRADYEKEITPKVEVGEGVLTDIKKSFNEPWVDKALEKDKPVKPTGSGGWPVKGMSIEDVGGKLGGTAGREETLKGMDRWRSPTSDLISKQNETKIPPGEWSKRIIAWGNQHPSIKDENKWSGINAYLESRSNEKSISKQDILDYMELSKGKWVERKQVAGTQSEETAKGGIKAGVEYAKKKANLPNDRWASYNIPGGIKGTEKVYTLQVPYRKKLSEVYTDAVEFENKMKEIYGNDVRKWPETVIDEWYNMKLPQFRSVMIGGIEHAAESGAYYSPHFPNQPNVVIHFRTQEMLDSKGQKGLMVETIQSDAHQAGTHGGNVMQENKTGKWVVVDKEGNIPERKFESKGEAEAWLNTNSIQIPFEKSWAEVGLKHALDIASQDKSIKWVGWPSGKVQNERWSTHETSFEWDRESGDRSKKGGTFLETLYDKRLPKFANKYSEKFGGKYKKDAIKGGSYGDDQAELLEMVRTGRVSNKKYEATLEPYDIHRIDLTPIMKKNINTKGQSFYKVPLAIGGGVLGTNMLMGGNRGNSSGNDNNRLSTNP